MHGSLGHMQTFDEARDLPRRGEAEEHAVHDDGGAVARLKVDAAIARRDPFKRVRFVDRLIGRLAELSQLLERARFAAALRFRATQIRAPTVSGCALAPRCWATVS